MLLGSFKRVPRYTPGTRLTSAQTRDIISSTTTLGLTVGDTIEVPDKWSIVNTIEQIGRLFISRYSFVYNNVLYPCYIKFIPLGDSRVSSGDTLIMHEGIRKFTAMLNGTKMSTLLKHALVSVALEELDHNDPGRSDMYRDTPMELGINSLVDNNTTDLLPDPSRMIEGYPWDRIHDLPKSIRFSNFNPSMRTLNFASYLSDLAVQVSPYEPVSDPIGTELVEYLTPTLPSQYTWLQYDPLTVFMATESGFPLREYKSKLTCQGSTTARALFTEFKHQEYEEIREFSSAIYQLCNWIQNLPFLECGGRYILPNRTTRTVESFEWTYRDGYSCISTDPYQKQVLAEQLRTIVEFWHLDLVSIEFFRTMQDECYIHFLTTQGMKKMYFDLSVMTLLTQVVTQIA